MKACPICKSTRLRMEGVPRVLNVGGAEVSGTVDAVVCRECGEHFIPAFEIRRFELQTVAALIDAGWFHPEVLRFARRAFGFTGRAFAELMAVAPETVSRWEHGRAEIPRSVFLFLSGAAKHVATSVHESLDAEGAARASDRLADPSLRPIVAAEEPPKLRLSA
jgi:transcriptional regulator with XRE-family HTH domain